MSESIALVEAVDLARSYRDRHGREFPAVRGIRLRIESGETLAVVGESGAGKSTLGKMLVGLETPTRGRLSWNGRPVRRLRGRAARADRRKHQFLFQDPRSSLNPRWTVERILHEALELGDPRNRARARRRQEVVRLLRRVDLCAGCLQARPHQLAGGEAQRVALARALAVSPDLIVLDEPFSALDMVTAAAVTDLLLEEQARYGTAYVLITHDLGRVGHLADRVAVMRHGQIVELARPDRLFTEPTHPYTRALLEAIPGRMFDAPIRESLPAFDRV